MSDGLPTGFIYPSYPQVTVSHKLHESTSFDDLPRQQAMPHIQSAPCLASMGSAEH